MAELPEKDRRVLLLRFYEDLPLADLGEAIGVSEQAAQKRVERALEHLRHFLVGRGAAVGAAALDGILRASAAQAAPAYLAKATIDLAFSGASTAAQSSAAFSLAKGTASLMAAAKTKTIAAIVVICLLIAPTTLIAIHYATSLFAQSPQLGPDPSTPVPTAGATRDIQTVYGLQNGEIIKRIVDAPPDVRKRFLQQQFPGQNNSTQVGHAFIGRAQDGFDIRFEARAYLLGSDYTFQNLVGFTSFARGISDPEFHIDAAIVNRRLTGDIVFKQDATDDEFCAGLAAFIHDQLAIEAAVVYRDVLMKVIVLSGHWKFTPVPQAPPTGKLANQCIEIYGDESLNRNSRSTGDNTTGRGHFARDLSDDLNQKVIIDVDRLPEYVSIRTYGTVPPEGPGRDLVLQHIQEQTGLTWTEEIRPVRCLLIETKKLAP
jgi:hypothetical protein